MASTFARFSQLVALSHSVFALPFALAALLLAQRSPDRLTDTQSFSTILLLVILAVVGARTAAMAFNRVVDARIDRLNPRTAMREIPKGEVTIAQGITLVIAASVLFLSASYFLGWHCFVLSPLVLFVLLAYSLTKRFTSYSHFVLGLALALAPGGAWWVIAPSVSSTPLLLMAGVLFWVAGFDVLYSCQDTDFDRSIGIHSVPARVGIPKALLLARAAHVVSFVCFVLVGTSAALGTIYFVGLLPIGALLAYQHTLVSPHDLSRINRAFFTVNGFVSVAYLVLVAIAY